MMNDLSEYGNNCYGFYCMWTIRNFSRCKPSKKLSISSQVFNVKTLRNTKWFLSLQQKKRKYLALFLYRKEDPKYQGVKFSFYIQTYFGWISIFDFKSTTYKPKEEFGNGMHDFIEWQKIIAEKSIYLPNDSLTIGVRIYKNTMKSASICCTLLSEMIDEIEVSHLSEQIFIAAQPDNLVMFPSSSTTKSPPKELKSQCIQADLTEFKDTFKDFSELVSLFEEKKFCLVTIRTENTQFSVYKAILCAKSPVFKAMFDKEMVENEKNVVDVKDINSRTMSLLLQFLHLEPLKELAWEEALKLYYAADKYQIQQLKEECVSFLIKELNERNVCEAFTLSDMHQDGDLKQAAIDYFNKHSKIILRSSEWKNFMLIETELASEMLSQFAEKLG